MLLVILPYIQIAISALLIMAVLMQKQGTGIGSAFGGGDGGSYASRRGFEKVLFYATIILAVLFLTSAFINLLLK
ncbi:MAG: preprotein translocase subunit SecG [Patescibacteria group bacterium]